MNFIIMRWRSASSNSVSTPASRVPELQTHISNSLWVISILMNRRLLKLSWSEVLLFWVSPTRPVASFWLPYFGELYHLHPSFLRMKPECYLRHLFFFSLPTCTYQILYPLNRSHLCAAPFILISHVYHTPTLTPCWSFTMPRSYSEVFSNACHHLQGQI